jgi:predicted Zn-dependent peptidase
MALAAERNDKNIDELRKIVEAAMKERDIAAEEIKRHKDMLDREYQRSKESMEAMQLLLKHDRGLVLKCPLM